MEVPAKYLSVSEAGDFKAEPFYTGSEYIYTKEIGNPFTKSQLTEIFNKSKRIIKGLPELPKITPTKVPQVTYKQIDEIAEKLKKKDITEKEFENLKVEIAIQKEAIDNNPAKGLTKYMSRVTGELPDVTGKPTMKSLTGSGKTVKNSEWGIRGDDIAKNIFGFEDTNSAQKALDDYLNAKARLNNVLIQTSNVRKEMAAIRRGEYLMQLAKGTEGSRIGLYKTHLT